MHRPVQRCVRFVCLPVVLLLTTPILGAAQLIYTNGVPDNIQGWGVYGPNRIANDFPLLSTTQLGSFEWYLLRSTLGPRTISSSFNWTIYNDAGGTVGSTVLGSGTVTNATGTKQTGFSYIFSNVSFGGLTLDAGRYWLAIGGYVDPTDPDYGYWATSAQDGNQAGQHNGSGWSSTDAEGAFSIYGTVSTVPEPGSLALLATGLVGLVPTFKRKLRL